MRSVLLDTGEELLAAALGEDSSLAGAARSIEPFIVPYDQLARVDGWVVWLGHPPVPDGLAILPISDHLLWDDPATAIAAAVAVAADYAARRGAHNADEMKTILDRESPLAFVVPDTITTSLRDLLNEAVIIGISIIERPDDLENSIVGLPSFAMRRNAHAAPVGRLHDPALSFQHFVAVGRAGGDGLSSFVVHDGGRVDSVVASGDTGEHLGIEVGVATLNNNPVAIESLEQAAALIPSFLNGVTSERSGDSLQVGWRLDARPSAQEIGEALRVWLKALHDLRIVDVRVAFAPAQKQSPVLAEMHARAVAIREARSALSGGPGRTDSRE